jgi:hypothetical protein
MDVIAEGLFADISSIDLCALRATSVVCLEILFGDAMPNEAAESMTIYIKLAVVEGSKLQRLFWYSIREYLNLRGQTN